MLPHSLFEITLYGEDFGTALREFPTARATVLVRVNLFLDATAQKV